MVSILPSNESRSTYNSQLSCVPLPLIRNLWTCVLGLSPILCGGFNMKQGKVWNHFTEGYCLRTFSVISPLWRSTRENSLGAQARKAASLEQLACFYHTGAINPGIELPGGQNKKGKPPSICLSLFSDHPPTSWATLF